MKSKQLSDVTTFSFFSTITINKQLFLAEAEYYNNKGGRWRREEQDAMHPPSSGLVGKTSRQFYPVLPG